MNRLAIIAATGVLALLLTACGDQGAKPADGKSDTTVVVTPDNTSNGNNGDNNAAQPATDDKSN